MDDVVKMNRREFLKTGIAGAGALILGVYLPGCGDGTEGSQSRKPFDPNAFLTIDESGTVTILAHRSEMGQGAKTGLTAVVASELGADWDQVTVRQAEGDAKYGSQNTDGSRSIRKFFEPMRKTGATVRTMLETAASNRWGAPVNELSTRQNTVRHDASDRSISFAELIPKVRNMDVPSEDEVTLKPDENLEYVGESLPIIDLQEIVHGEETFGIDVTREDMLYAVIERNPHLEASPSNFNAQEVEAKSGVRDVIQIGEAHDPPLFHPLPGVAVVAEDTWAAQKGREALKVEWDPGPHASYDTDQFKQSLEETAREPAKTVRNQGDVDSALGGANEVLESVYHVPHLAQAPMEPPCAVAEYSPGNCEIWAPTQAPQRARTQVAKALELDEENVTVNVARLGGGFGRKSKPDYIVEAALLSRQLEKPVQVLWTREDDIQEGYFHSISAQYLKAGLDSSGRPNAWLHRSVFPTISSTFSAGATHAGDTELALGFVDTPFDIPNLRCENGEADAHLRIGWMRSVANIYHAFAVQSFADEIAHARGVDPKQNLIELIGNNREIDFESMDVTYTNYGESLEKYPYDTSRLKEVIRRVTREANWDGSTPSDHYQGLAAHRSFLSYVATVVEISMEKGSPVVHRVDSAIDCGRIVNPDRVRAQVEGGAVYGLSLALHGKITTENGEVQQTNFNNYRVLRMNEAPDINVHLVERENEPPGGVGEPGTPPVTPALTNAIFAATGQRIRRLPVDEQV